MVDYACSKAGALALHEGLAAELATRYDAPRVRTVCVTPNWVATKLTEGWVQRDRFVLPVLAVETLAEAVLDQILRGESGKVVRPRTAGWLGLTHFRAWPLWAQTLMRKNGGEGLRTWRGRGQESEGLLAGE